jgi:hypothetical protein
MIGFEGYWFKIVSTKTIHRDKIYAALATINPDTTVVILSHPDHVKKVGYVTKLCVRVPEVVG